MPSFFHTWRRKFGVVTLVTACVFMAGWVRSRIVMDDIQFSIGNRQHEIMTSNGIFEWGAWDRDSGLFWGMSSTLVTPEFWTFSPHAWDDIQKEPEIGFEIWRLSYSSIAVPLAMTAMFLLLWPTRRATDSTA